MHRRITTARMPLQDDREDFQSARMALRFAGLIVLSSARQWLLPRKRCGGES